MSTLRYRIFDQPVDFVDCPEIATGFRSIVRGWGIEQVPSTDEPPYLLFSRKPYGYHWQAPWVQDTDRRTSDPSRSQMDAVCDFHYEIIDWYVDLHPEQFCLHAAGCVVGGKSIIFPCVQKAGKSILSMQLALAGHRLLGDDVIGLTPDAEQAISLGLLPRVRLPLPIAFISPDLVEFVSKHAGLSDSRYQYVELPDDKLAALGESFSVSGIVILERGAGHPELTPIPKSVALKALIDQNFGRLRNPNAIFDRLRQIALDSDCLLLRYARPENAVALLEQHFAE